MQEDFEGESLGPKGAESLFTRSELPGDQSVQVCLRNQM